MQPHQQRVVDEKTELDDRLKKLIAFYNTGTFVGLDKVEKDRLTRQGQVMSEYSDILGERIAAFR